MTNSGHTDLNQRKTKLLIYVTMKLRYTLGNIRSKELIFQSLYLLFPLNVGFIHSHSRELFPVGGGISKQLEFT